MGIQDKLLDRVAEDGISLDGDGSILDIDSIGSTNKDTIKLILVRFIWGLKTWKFDRSKAETELEVFETKQVIDLMNHLFDEAITYLRDNLYYTEKELKQVVWYEFNNFDDVLDFLQHSNRPRWKIFCTVAKQVLAILEWSSLYNERIEEIKNKTHDVIEWKLKGPLQIDEETEDEIRWSVYTHGRNISFVMKNRAKTDKSNISKWTRDPKYLTWSYLSDLYWVTFEIEHRKDIPYFMDFVASKVFKRGIFEIKNKGLLGKKIIEECEGLNWDFQRKLIDSVDKEDKKEGSSPEYEDIKLMTPLYKDDEARNLSLEIKFVLSGNINERGLQMQWVYWYFKKISERIRLEW